MGTVLSIVPRHCARLTYFIHPELRKINAVLITLYKGGGGGGGI